MKMICRYRQFTRCSYSIIGGSVHRIAWVSSFEWGGSTNPNWVGQFKANRATDSTQPEPIVELFQEAKMYRSHLKGNIHRVDCLYKNLHSSEDPSSSETVLFINEGAKPQVNCHHHSCKEKDSSIEAYIEKFDELGLNTLNFKNQWSDKRCFPGSNILVPKLPLKFDSKGNVKAPKVDFVANYIHSLAGIDLKRWFGDLFVWNGSFWKHVDDPLNIFDFFHWVSSGLYSQGVATSVYQTLLGKVQKFEISPWEQNTKKLAVGNGDISLVLKGDKWIAELRPHDRKNNLIGKIEYDYVVGEKNVDFMELLTKLLGPVELDSRVKAISEMYGLMIFPVVPKIFNLIGPPGSGKSTLGKFGVKLLSENTRSGVDPSLFCKFNMESMIGKRANICLDVDFTKPIEDANIKKIEDDEPISIDRKFKPAILARLPLFHLFCSNDLLTCHDRGTGAQGRRWTLIKIDSQRFNESNQNRNIVNEIFLTNPSGILNFAIEGAVGILNRNRQTTVPTSSKVLMDKWLMSSNPIAQYVVEIRNDENTFIKLDPTGEIYRTELWINFVEWYEKSFNRKPFITASKFYDRIHESFMETKKNGDRYIIGFRNRSIHEPANPNTLQGVKMNRGF